ncbi:hypothetical protein WKH31_08210 [Metabacillus indicus]|uniref:hypothetical protein n=1 Tax=Metabacillus indicus TaxID=246786 RepID=UPI00316D16E2
MFLIKEYLPLMAAVIATSLAYLYGQKNNKVSNFHDQAKESLDQILGSMYFSLRQIIKLEDVYEKEYELEKWFDRYTSEITTLYKLGDKWLIDNFISLNTEYKKIKEGARTDQSIKAFNRSLDLYFTKLDKHYWTTFTSLYREYSWFNRILNAHFSARLFLEVLKPLRNILQLFFLTSLVTLFLGLLLWLIDKIDFSQDSYLIPIEYIILAGSILFLSFLLLMFTEIFIQGTLFKMFEIIGIFVEKLVKLFLKFLMKLLRRSP